MTGSQDADEQGSARDSAAHLSMSDLRSELEQLRDRERQIAELATRLYAARRRVRLKPDTTSAQGAEALRLAGAGADQDATYVVSAFRRTSAGGWKRQGRLEGLRR